MLRAYFDLIGLPPTGAKLTSLSADSSANAYEMLITKVQSHLRGGNWS